MRQVEIENKVGLMIAETKKIILCPLSFENGSGVGCAINCAWFRIGETWRTVPMTADKASFNETVTHCFCGDNAIGELVGLGSDELDKVMQELKRELDKNHE